MREIEQQQLANGIILTYSDASKKVAGDRWFIRMICTAEIPFAEWMMEELDGDSPEDVFVREKLANRLAHEIFMERNFVDEEEKDAVTDKLQGRIKQNLVSYLAKEDFIRKLFFNKVADLRDEFSMSCAHLLRPVEAPEDDSCDDGCGPADFSACFR